MNRQQATELTLLIKAYAEAYSDVDRAEGSWSWNERTTADRFVSAQAELTDKINELTERAKC